MTSSPMFTVHPNGTKFEYIPGGLKYVLWGGKYVAVRDKSVVGGVVVTFKDGVKIFRPNAHYD